MDKKNIFVVGLNEFNRGELESIDQAEKYNFISLFHSDEVMQQGVKPDIEKFINEAKEKLDNFEGSIDGIISFFDFPVTLLTFYLCDEYNTKGPSLWSGIQCEHKYWSRIEQQKVVPDNIPRFAAINPFDPPAFDDIDLKTPFWIKPIKAFGSQLGFKITSEKEYNESLEQTREQIEEFAEPFNYLLSKIELPEEVAGIDGCYCIAEEWIAGYQCTVSGYVYEGDVKVYGIVDSINYEDTPSFFYYLLPTRLPESVQKRLSSISKKVMKQIDFDNSPFNIEFYYDEKNDSIHLLEINPRMSQSHSDLYAKVHGSSNHEILVEIASGRKPDYSANGGDYNCSAKMHFRVFEDGIVQNVPSEEEIEEIKKEYPDTLIFTEVEKGDKLSDLPGQDSYSYRIAIFYMGADNEEGLIKKYNKIVERLNIDIK